MRLFPRYPRPEPVEGRVRASVPAQEAVDRMRRQLAVLHAFDRQVLAGLNAVAAGPDAAQRGLLVLVHQDAAGVEIERLDRAVAQRRPDEDLADRLDHHVGLEREAIA